jgi:hypothetical protein
VEAAQEQIQKSDDLSVCIGARDRVGGCTVSQVLLWLRHGGSLGTQMKENVPVGSRYQRTGEQQTREDSVLAVVNCRLCELAIAPQ